MKSIIFLTTALLLSACSKEVAVTYLTKAEQASNKQSIQCASLKDEQDQKNCVQTLFTKYTQKSLVSINQKMLSNPVTLESALNGHTKLFEFRGQYRIMVIPVQFSDEKFVDPDFFERDSSGRSKAQEYLFGKSHNSMSQYYAHASMGKLDLKGEVTPVVTVDNTLKFYGEAMPGSNDKNARGLVVDSISKLRQIITDESWWANFDRWDLSDYDEDKNFHEPDGFIDAVVLIYAGKSQSSCQRSFDPDGKKPPSSEVEDGPRHDATVECFNRIWPHRWSISLSDDDPRYTEIGPKIEGVQRPSMNGLKISDSLFASDYNMQSEFSDISTFIHEFAHSLSLPDIYSKGKLNSTGNWEIMSSNANLQAQEMSSYSKLSLGWLSPKIIREGEKTSAYLGAYNFVTEIQREDRVRYLGPLKNFHGNSILSKIPDFDEDVYRSIVVLTNPTNEQRQVTPKLEMFGETSAYSGRYDGESRSLSVTVDVPLEGDAIFTFDTIYKIETETNFNSKEEEIKVITDFDLGKILVNNKLFEKLRTQSGDADYDSLSEANPSCPAKKVLKLRSKKIDGSITEQESEEFKKGVAICQKPHAVTKLIDLSDHRGKEITVEIQLITDAGYTEMGVIVDNIRFNNTYINFENGTGDFGQFKPLERGEETLQYAQFYLMEYRTPGESYDSLSLNMDNNIKPGNQSMFLPGTEALNERYRMLTYKYRPGVLVWYFNSKFNRQSNNPAIDQGKGYLLVLNSKVQEMKIPGIFSNISLLDENGHYREKDEDFKLMLKNQNHQFLCFSHIEYATYLNGKRPECDGEFQDYLKSLTFNGKKMLWRREKINTLLPIDRYNVFSVGKVFRNSALERTGLSTFNPEGETFAPFTVYKEENGEMVIDREMTQQTAKIKSISSFNDAQNKWSGVDKFKGDTAVVEKKGLSFRVVNPSPQVISTYKKDTSAEDNNNFFRRPRAKVYFSWKK